MPHCRSPESQQDRSPLDELAELLVKDTTQLTPEDTDRLSKLFVYLRGRLSRKGGIAPQDAPELAESVIAAFVHQVRRQPGNLKLVNGAYLWGVAKRKIADHIKAQIRHQALVENYEDATPEGVDKFREACREDYEKKQELMSLQARAHQILQRAAGRDKSLLGQRLEAAVQMVMLLSAECDSVDAVFRLTAERLVDLGILGGNHTRNLKARFDRQPELRRELGAPQRSKASKVIQPATVKPGTPSTEK